MVVFKNYAINPLVFQYILELIINYTAMYFYNRKTFIGKKGLI